MPLNVPGEYDDTKPFSHAVARLLERSTRTSCRRMKKQLRAGKVFVDWSQNDPHKTTVCVYSLRARQRPTVSTPLTWAEVEKAARTATGRRARVRGSAGARAASSGTATCSSRS